ncbi:ComEC/Rec2 family competence protein [Brevundimonas sp. AJA228-03]|uniref:ComEC/Rec2 family competence protein n=1 Tax=Brevundimonas sp. AJA228-03 TaxID=2752515 RepID=UPI001AE0E8E9|nr:ComEC/Rec2 family competence protein [Brevundimonas sp. AJA228-03]QTN18628.1 ComEC/Rec2 family competence protein [Brevundimonas sp. AJA228-03]
MGGVSGRAALIPPDAAKPSPRERIAAWLSDEVRAQSLRWRLLAPVAFGCGAALYFALKREPPLWPLLGMAGAMLAIWLGARWRGNGRRITLPLMLLACLACGLAGAKVRSDRVAAPIAPAMAEPTVIEGWVVDVDSPGDRGHRVVVAPVRVQGLLPEATPIRLRATVRGEPPVPGSAIRLYAILNPPPPPASPGAYDFGRGAWFDRLGGTAFALGETRTAGLPAAPWSLRMAMRVNAMRFALARRIVDRLGERTGGIAAAMTTGHETWIQREDLDAMRDSGLAHILSISGLHMAIVGGFAFFLVRFGVAAWPWLALRVSGKKVAAVAGLIAVWSYLVLSGAPAPAERSAITASIAFAAILLDRPAISMHGLAVAAMVVLILQPEAIVTPGFQMSFAATAALVALAEAWPPRTRALSVPWPIALIQSARHWLVIAVSASFVAGAATGPFAIQHFNRTAVFGLIANLATSPIADFIMMPALALGALLEPVGLGGPFLWVAGKGVDAMLFVGHRVTALPGAVRTIASAPDHVLPISFLGVLFVCLWQGRLRWAGLPFVCAVLIWPRDPTPTVWIGDGGINAAYSVGGQAVVVRPGVRDFATEVWSRRRGLTRAERDDAGWICERYACAPRTGHAPLAVWWGKVAPDAEALAGLCASAPLVSVRATVSALPSACADRLVLDGVDYARGGAVELWQTPQGWRAVWSADTRGDRPWSRPGQGLRPFRDDKADPDAAEPGSSDTGG